MRSWHTSSRFALGICSCGRAHSQSSGTTRSKRAITTTRASFSTRTSLPGTRRFTLGCPSASHCLGDCSAPTGFSTSPSTCGPRALASSLLAEAPVRRSTETLSSGQAPAIAWKAASSGRSCRQQAQLGSLEWTKRLRHIASRTKRSGETAHLWLPGGRRTWTCTHCGTLVAQTSWPQPPRPRRSAIGGLEAEMQAAQRHRGRPPPRRQKTWSPGCPQASRPRACCKRRATCC
mmetsp:Transcript_8359/g.21298  ORF Transcript_8359/g.21298 Transcript_8359/m.21298 type:complete len:233 (-) Transcript_8359:349-1047(-)